MVFRFFKGVGGGASGGEAGPHEPAEQIEQVLKRLDALGSALGGLVPAEGGETVTEALSRMEQRDIHAVSAIDTFATALKSLSHHLAHLRQSTRATASETTAKLNAIEARLQAGQAVDFGPIAAALDVIGQRLSGLEAKMERKDLAPPENDAVAATLAAISDRLGRVEAKLNSVAQQPSLEPEATANLLRALVQRLGAVEGKVDSGTDGTSIAACLLAVDRRLSRIETGLGMDVPPPPTDVPDLAALREDHAAAIVPPTAEDAPPASPAKNGQPASPAGDGAQPERVDQLLEQVFRVLAR